MEKTLGQKPSSCLKVVLFGPESTGKTTMTHALANYYKGSAVDEYMRDYLQKKWDDSGERSTIEDLIPMAQGQMQLENQAAALEKNYLFCDTNLLELAVYSRYYFDGFCPPKLETYALKNQYDLYFLTDIDVPWEADVLRDRPNDRSRLFRIFERELQQQQLPYHILSGAHQQRLQTAIQIIDNLQLTNAHSN